MTKDLTYERISGSLGSLLLLWSAIERQARKEVSSVHDGCLPRSAYGIAAVLNAWKDTAVATEAAGSLRGLLASTLRVQLQEPLDVRNGLCHGLIGISSAFNGRPAGLTWEINDDQRSIDWDELQTTFGWLSKVPYAISIISNSPMEEPGNRLIDGPENRAWWLAEYGIELSSPSAMERH